MVQLNVSEFLDIKGLNHNKQQQIESRISPLANHLLRKVAQNKTLVLLHVYILHVYIFMTQKKLTTPLHISMPEKNWAARPRLWCYCLILQATAMAAMPRPCAELDG